MDTPIYDGMARDPWWGDPAAIIHEIRVKVDPLYRVQPLVQKILDWANLLGNVLGIGDIA